MASIGDIVIYQTTQAERDMYDVTDTEWPAIVTKAHTATDCDIAIFCPEDLGQSSKRNPDVSPVVYGCTKFKRCDEDASAPYDEGTWRLK